MFEEKKPRRVEESNVMDKERTLGERVPWRTSVHLPDQKKVHLVGS